MEIITIEIKKVLRTSIFALVGTLRRLHFMPITHHPPLRGLRNWIVQNLETQINLALDEGDYDRATILSRLRWQSPPVYSPPARSKKKKFSLQRMYDFSKLGNKIGKDIEIITIEIKKVLMISILPLLGTLRRLHSMPITHHHPLRGMRNWIVQNLETRINLAFDEGDYDLAIKLSRVRRQASHVHALPVKSNIKKYSLQRMYDFLNLGDNIAYEDEAEVISINKPHVLGRSTGNLTQGNALCPKHYVAVIKNTRVFGGSSLVITKDGIILNDELVDFPEKHFGIKPKQIIARHEDSVILVDEDGSNTKITKGIILSCDHDNNYFHWLIECLPRLLFIDELPQYDNVPLLILNELHANLEDALNRLNTKSRGAIRLDAGVPYQVDELIFPSNLSRVLDRYSGQPVYDTDVVISHRWVNKVRNNLLEGVDFPKKPWRKLYLRRRSTIRWLENQAEIERLLVERGFEVIDLEGASLSSQFTLFSQSSVIVAPSGAALTNLLFCSPGTRAIVFTSNHESMNFYIWQEICDIAGVNISFVVGERLYELQDWTSVHDNYVIDPKTLLEVL